MKIKLRKKVFETNSSSIHSFCIYKGEQNLYIPKFITLRRQSFGWKNSRIEDVEEKLNYFYEMCLYYDYKHYLVNFDCAKEPFKENSLTKMFIEYLESRNAVVEYCLSNDIYAGGIDHCDCYGILAKELLERNESELDNFLFNSKSLVVTTNDNLYEEDQEQTPNKNDYTIYYKGN